MRPVTFAGILASTTILSGVAAIAGGVLLGSNSSIASAAQTVQDDTASQMASTPRRVTNAAKTAAAPAPMTDIPFDSSQPAIDEKSFTAPLQSSVATGQGGPFIAASASSTPVASTLINGEPVVVLRIGPIFATNAPTSAAASSAVQETASPVSYIGSSAPSPQAILSLSMPEEQLASVEPQLTAARPRSKPAVTELAAVVPAKPKTVARPTRVAEAPVAAAADEPDVYQPPSISDLAYDEIPAAISGTQVPGDNPAEHQAIPVTVPSVNADSAPAVPATGGPAPLVQSPEE
jgi:hypothetical protein